jgi:hypothetical protein
MLEALPVIDWKLKLDDSLCKPLIHNV